MSVSLVLAFAIAAIVAEPVPASPSAEGEVSLSQPFIGSPVWNRKPNDADFARFYPAGYRPASPRFGGVMLDCGVRADGTLYGCKADPSVSDMRVADASVAVAAAYRMDPKAKDGMPTAGGRVRLSITWSAPRGNDVVAATSGGAAPLLSLNSPLWLKRPSQEEVLAEMPVTTRLAGGKGEAVVRCQVEDTGDLRLCAVESETPGLGLGSAAKDLARKMSLPKPATTWRRGPVRVRIRFDAAASALPAPARETPRAVELAWTDPPTAETMKALYAGAIPGNQVEVPFVCAVGYGGLLGDCLAERDTTGAEAAVLKALTKVTTRTPEKPQGQAQGTLVRGTISWLNGRPYIRSLAPPPALPIPPVRERPSRFVKTPSQDDFRRLYPPAALAAGRYGWATLKCGVRPDGRLSGCAVEGEYPRGMGFADATIAVAPLYQMRPQAEGGPKSVTLPIEWRLPNGPAGYNLSGVSDGQPWDASPPPPLELPPVSGRVEMPAPPIAVPASPSVRAPTGAIITKPDWLRRPNGDDMARYFPEAALKAGVAGRATIACKVKDNGSLEACSVQSEDPPGLGFGDAALRVSRLFKMKPQQKDGAPVAGATIRIPLLWNLPIPPLPVLSPPPPLPLPPVVARRIEGGPVEALARVIVEARWERRPTSEELTAAYPERAMRLEKTGRTTMICKVTAEGLLEDCGIVAEDPADLGFGEASLSIAPLFKMKPIQPDGTPVAGATVRIPFVWNLPAEPDPRADAASNGPKPEARKKRR